MVETALALPHGHDLPACQHAWQSGFTSLREILQVMLDGARLGGASWVAIDYEAQSGVLRMRDNGSLPCGPLAFNAVRLGLLNAGTSLERFRRDLIRYPAILTLAAHCKVLTPTFGVSFSPALFLAGNPVTPIPHPVLSDGVTIVLKLLPEWACSTDVMADYLRRLVTGWPVKVEFNKNDLPRPFALPSEHFTRFAYGHLWHESGHGPGEDYLFLNGLPVVRTHPWAPVHSGGRYCVHLDPEFFAVKPPGLHHLVGAETMLSFLRVEIERIHTVSQPRERWA